MGIWTSKPIERVDVRALPVSLQGVDIELDGFCGGLGRLVQVVVISVKSHCMTCVREVELHQPAVLPSGQVTPTHR